MTLLAGLIFLLSPVAFFAGLVNPRWVLPGENPTRYTSSLVYLGLFIVSTVGVGTMMLKTPQQPALASATLQADTPVDNSAPTIRRFYRIRSIPVRVPMRVPVRVYRQGRVGLRTR